MDKIDSYVPKERLLSEIEKINPDVVVMDLDLFSSNDGIETKEKIRDQLDIPVLYEWSTVMKLITSSKIQPPHKFDQLLYAPFLVKSHL